MNTERLYRTDSFAIDLASVVAVTWSPCCSPRIDIVLHTANSTFCTAIEEPWQNGDGDYEGAGIRARARLEHFLATWQAARS